MVRAEHFLFANGWTVSLADDTNPAALCNVAAWPTHLGNAATGDAPRDQGFWFDFTPPSDDPSAIRDRSRRCWSLEDMVEALRLVANAPRPQVSAHAAGASGGPIPNDAPQRRPIPLRVSLARTRLAG